MKKTWMVLVIAATGMLMASPAQAASKPVDSYCSPTGDYCQGLLRAKDGIKADLRAFSFRGTYQLCVDPPKARQSCERFRFRRASFGIFKGRVTLARHFDLKRRGRYSVTWRTSGFKIGQTLHFRKR